MPKDSKYICQDIIEDNILCEYGLICGKCFVRKGDLMRHRKIHTGIMDFKCDVCGKEFQQKTQLTNHQNTHTGHAPHKCDICQEAFKDPSSCCRHRKEQHEGDYVCFVDNCGKNVSRKCNFRKHLQGHNEYRADMDLENYWVRRDHPRPKRIESSRRPSKKRVTTEVENPPVASLKLEALEEGYEPIKLPQLHTIDSSSSAYRTPYLVNVPLPYALPEQPYEFQVDHNQCERTLWQELQEWQSVIDAQNAQNHSSPSFTPPSLSSSLSSSPDLPLRQAYPGAIDSYPQSLPYSLPQPRYDAQSPISWFEPLIAKEETLPLPIDRLGLLESSSIFDPSLYTKSVGEYSAFTANLQMVN